MDRVRALHYSVTWVDRHPLSWEDGAFPATYRPNGWTLTLSRTNLHAVPQADLALDEARQELAELLDSWALNLEVEQSLGVMFGYLSADIDQTDRDVGIISCVVSDSAGSVDEEAVRIVRSAPPEPDWSWRDTQAAALARSRCLRPLRNGTRPVFDAGYWLSTHLVDWASSEPEAANRLSVSGSYLSRARVLAARSDERKAAPSGQRSLTEAEKESLRKVLEELVKRLHLVESGLPPGPPLDVSDWPNGT